MKYQKLKVFGMGILCAALIAGCGAKEKKETEAKTEAAATEAATTEEATTEEAKTEAVTEKETAEKAAEETSADKISLSDLEVEDETENGTGIHVKVADFELTMIDGTTAKLSDYKGKKVLINFWATWCGPCVGEMPAFQKLAEEYPDELAILAVNCGEDAQTVQKFAEKNGYTFPIATDTSGEIQQLFGGISSIPATGIIDEEGYLIDASMGASDAETMYTEYKDRLGF